MLICNACLLCVILTPAATVIAAQTQVETTAAPETASGSNWLTWLILAILSAASLWICYSRGIFRNSSESGTAAADRFVLVSRHTTVFLVGMLLPGILAAPAGSITSSLLSGKTLPDLASITLSGILIDSSAVSVLLVLMFLVRKVSDDRGISREPTHRSDRKHNPDENKTRTEQIVCFFRKLPLPLRSLAAGVAGLLLTLPVAFFTGIIGAQVQEMITGSAPDPLSHQTLRLLREVGPDQQIWIWLTFLLVVLPVPMLEEITYRYGLQRIFVKATGGVFPGVIMTAVIFSTLHIGVVPAAALPELFVLGVGFGLVYERSGMLSAAMVMHGLFNALNIISALLLN